MIILDVEWNRGYDNTPLDEILQIGAVRVDKPGGAILDSFNACIRPVIHKRFGPGAKTLPELGMYQESDLDFPAAMAAFREWCGAETQFAAWGGDDFRVLARNCEYWELQAFAPERCYDFQQTFSHVVGADGKQIALWRAVEYCGVPDSFTFHNALNDAVYTAVVSQWFAGEEPVCASLEASPRKSLKLSQLSFPPQPKFRIGPCLTWESILNARKARTPACPVCGRKIWVQQWRTASARQYYSIFRCPEHGRFLCRLSLTPMEDGKWRGRLAVPAVTPELLREYVAASNGSSYICKGTHSRRIQRRRRQRERRKKQALETARCTGG